MAYRPVNPRVRTWKLPAGPLWADDLQRIWELAGEAGIANLSGQVDNWIIDSPEDLAAVLRDHSADFTNGKIRRFSLRDPDNNTTLVLTGFGSGAREMRIVNPGISHEGFARSVENVMTERRNMNVSSRLLFIALRYGLLSIFPILVGLLIWFPLDSSMYTGDAVASLVLILTFPAVLFSGALAMRQYSPIYAAAYHDAPPWLVRNKDSLVTNFIVSLTFFIVGYFVGQER